MTDTKNAAGPIGVFDSGLGGLTAVRELRRILPGEDLVYFGDTGRVPYGSRGIDTIINYAKQDIAFLLSKNVKAILAACGTVSSTFPKAAGEALPLPYLGVVQPTSRAAAKATKTGRVGIIGTETTIASRSYQGQLAEIDPNIECFAVACPLFVALVENGHFAPDDAMATLAAEEYLGPIKAAGVDTLVMGCTHYPLLAGVLARQLGESVTLIDSGREAALALKARLEAEGLLAAGTKQGSAEYYVSDDPSRFDHLAHIFMGEAADGRVQRIDIEKYSL